VVVACHIPLHSGSVFASRVPLCEPGVEVTSVEGIERAPDYLHVLLRHRLLLQPRLVERLTVQPECMQGSLQCQVVLPAENQPVSKPDAVVEVALHPDPAAVTLSPQAYPGQDAIIAYRDQLLDWTLIAIPRLIKLNQPARDRLATVARHRVGKLAHWVVIAIRVPELGDDGRPLDTLHLRFPEEAANDLHVLLRHRLLLQAEVGEGAVALEVGDEPRDFAVADMKEACSLRGGLPSHLPNPQSAPLGARTAILEHEHTLAIQLPVLVSVDAPVFPHVEEVVPRLPH